MTDKNDKNVGKKYSIRLTKMGDVARMLRRMTVEVYEGSLDTKRASTCGYLLNLLRGVQESDDLAARVQELEERITALQRGRAA